MTAGYSGTPLPRKLGVSENHRVLLVAAPEGWAIPDLPEGATVRRRRQPRRAGGHRSDVTDKEVRAAVLPTGLVDVKVAALDHDWSALKFVRRSEDR